MSFVPIFKQGLILKQYMLEALRDYPHDFVNTFFSQMGDGVITGLDITLTENNCFIISRGIVKIDGKVYFLTEEIVLEPLEERNYVYLEVMDSQMVDGTEITLRVVQKQEEDSSLFELFRYIKNAVMKDYVDIKEIFGEITNRVDQRNSLKSVIGGSTVCDRYYRLFANYILKSNNKNVNVQDVSFAYQCLNGISNIDVVVAYFNDKNVTNDRVLFFMKKRVHELENSDNVKPVAETEVKRERKMMIS